MIMIRKFDINKYDIIDLLETFCANSNIIYYV